MAFTTERPELSKLSDAAERQTITSDELAKVIINSDGPQTGLARGRARYLHGRRDIPEAAKLYLEALVDALGVDDGAAKVSAHPASTVRPTSPNAEAQPLTPVDLAWLSGLPADPEKVSYADACHLATLAQRTQRSGVPETDRRLVEQRWAPIADAYDLREADRISKMKYRTLPDPTGALASLIAGETTELSERECHYRAQELGESINQKMMAFRQDEQAQAHRIRTEVTARTQARTSTDAPVSPQLPVLQRD